MTFLSKEISSLFTCTAISSPDNQLEISSLYFGQF